MTGFRYSRFGKTITRLIAGGFAILMLLALPALAETLDGARAKGLIGERPDGYVGAVVSPTADIQALITKVNTQRRAKYEQIAQQKGVPVDQISALTAEKIIQGNLQSGWYYMDASGNWVKK
jgi:uncharacterized protein YdbL (DUF1318 family)